MFNHRIIPVLLFSGLSPMCNAADFGLGVSLNTNATSIFLPIEITKSYRVEPFVNYNSFEESDSLDSNNTYKREYSSSSFGLGFFKTLDLKTDINSYWGVRISYVTREDNSIRKDDDSEYFNMDKVDGYSISPAFGIEYSITQNFFIGFEGSWYYESLTGSPESYSYRARDDWDESNGEIIRINSSQKRTGTNSMVTFRYMFK